jgi:hypothetical protein
MLDVYGNMTPSGDIHSALWRVNRQVRGDQLQVLLRLNFWIVFRVHHPISTHAPRSQHGKSYHLPSLRFLAHSPTCLVFSSTNISSPMLETILGFKATKKSARDNMLQSWYFHTIGQVCRTSARSLAILGQVILRYTGVVHFG